MSNLIKKVVAGFSTLALSASMLVMPFATTVHAASAGEVYKTTDGTVWFITSDMQRRPFTSAGAFLSYGFLSFSQVKEVDASVSALPSGSFIAPQDGRIFCATETKATDVKGECSLITGGKKAAFTSATVFAGQGYSFARAYYGDSSFLEKTTNIDNSSAQHRPGTLINNNGTIQMVVVGGLWGTPSMDVFNSWGWNLADVVPANSADVLLSQIGIIPARQAGQLVPTGVTGGVTPPTPTPACSLDGTTGDLTVSASSTYSAEEVGEDQDEAPVLAFELEADNSSDVEVTSVKVELVESGTTSSNDITDYAKSVSIMYNGEIVGSADADEFSETANVYTKSISLDCAVILAGDKEMFTVVIDGLSTIDSGDHDSDAWTADVLQVRFLDGDGVTTTDDTDASTLEKTFNFTDFATAADTELKVSLNDANEAVNVAHIIDVSDTAATNTVEILSFKLEAEGSSDILIKDLPVLLTTTEAAGTDFNDPDDIITSVSLKKGATVVATETLLTTDADGDTELVTFDDIDLIIAAGDTETFTVTINLISTSGVLDDGDTIMADLTATEVDLILAEDESGADLLAADLTGTADGQASAVYAAGIMTEFVSANEARTLIADAAGEFDQGTFNITFTATAFDGDFRIDKSCEEGGADAAGQGVEYNITNPGSNATTCVVTSSSTDTEDTADVFEVDEDTTRTFTLTVNATSSADAFAEVSLESINWGTVVGNTNANYYTFDLGDYKTNAIFLNTF